MEAPTVLDRLTPAQFALLNDYQQRFPLCPAPFAEIAAERGLAAETVLDCYRAWQTAGLISRIGPVFAPHRLGVSTLAALAVPPERLAAVAAQVSAQAEVNHNYAREDVWNLWFVATAPHAARLAEVLAGLAKTSGCPLLDLPLEAAYHIDLGFDLLDGTLKKPPAPPKPPQNPAAPCALAELDRRILAQLETGLPLTERPYARLAAAAGVSEAWLLTRLEEWQAAGIIRRFGVVVRHHELGYRANAMCVWDVPDAEVDAIGARLARQPGVTLCYRRRRQPPAWPYNLFCMLHGQARQTVLARHAALAATFDLAHFPQRLLFSARRFKQRGASYRLLAETDHA